MNYKTNETNTLENNALNILKSLGFDIISNNKINITDTDYIIKENNKNIYVDFQYSTNFKKYGDLRADIISAYNYQNNHNYKTAQDYFDNYDFNKNSSISFINFLNNILDIKKFGKILNIKDSQYPTGLVYFFYNNDKFDLLKPTPDFIYFVKTEDLFNFIKNNWQKLIKNKKFKLNNKNDLGDFHGSAFFALKLEDLLKLNIGYKIDVNQIKKNLLK